MRAASLSPELVLIDPDLREAALAAYQPPGGPGAARGLPAASTVRLAEPRKGLALWLSVGLNLVLLTLLLTSRAPARPYLVEWPAPGAEPATRSVGSQPATTQRTSPASDPVAAHPRPVASRLLAERRVLDSLRAIGRPARFVDPLTKLVEANVAVRCTPSGARRQDDRASAFVCRVWQQPGSPSTGVVFVYRAKAGGGFSTQRRPLSRR